MKGNPLFRDSIAYLYLCLQCWNLKFSLLSSTTPNFYLVMHFEDKSLNLVTRTLEMKRLELSLGI